MMFGENRDKYDPGDEPLYFAEKFFQAELGSYHHYLKQDK